MICNIMPEIIPFKSTEFNKLKDGGIERITIRMFYEKEGGVVKKLPGEETKKEIIPIVLISYLSQADLFLNSMYLSYIGRFLDDIYSFK